MWEEAIGGIQKKTNSNNNPKSGEKGKNHPADLGEPCEQLASEMLLFCPHLVGFDSFYCLSHFYFLGRFQIPEFEVSYVHISYLWEGQEVL